MINKTIVDIINNAQVSKKQVVYHENNIYAASNIGKIRSTQEDSLIILRHPYNFNFCLIAIADGMGGLDNGAYASNLALLEIFKWFIQLPKDCYYIEKDIYKELVNKVYYIDSLIRKKCNKGGTTLSIAIVSAHNTIFLNLGDTRIYIYKNYHLQQISIDHSISWNLYEKKIIENKDDIRFHKDNNLIYSRLGCEARRMTISSRILKNIDYDYILILSDGVTDCLSDELIRKNIKSYNDVNIAEELVKLSLDTNSYQNYLETSHFYSQIFGGKDNSTAIVLKKSR